jgi:hypothetical protein
MYGFPIFVAIAPGTLLISEYMCSTDSRHRGVVVYSRSREAPLTMISQRSRGHLRERRGLSSDGFSVRGTPAARFFAQLRYRVTVEGQMTVVTVISATTSNFHGLLSYKLGKWPPPREILKSVFTTMIDSTSSGILFVTPMQLFTYNPLPLCHVNY